MPTESQRWTGRSSAHLGHWKIFTAMKETEFARKIDSTGRIIIPSQLRNQLNIHSGDTHTFFLHNEDGRTFLCIECFNLENEVEKAKRILRENGIKI